MRQRWVSPKNAVSLEPDVELFQFNSVQLS